MDDTFGRAKRHFLDGTAHLQAGRLAEAQACFESSLSLLPNRVSTQVNLAATHIGLGRPQQALTLLDAALASSPDDADAWLQRARACGALQRHADEAAAWHRRLALMPDDAEGWFRHGRALQQLERHAEALASYERALALDPALAAAWTNRGAALKALGLTGEAAASFRAALAHGGDAALNGYYLAALGGGAPPPAPPRDYVQGLFDGYADSFDTHLVNALHYRAPRVLARLLEGERFGAVLELGCGTGLCAPLVGPLVQRLDGVDLSAPMLEKARALGLYDRLAQADLVEHLNATERRYDLVLAADVFIYVGALEAAFAGVCRVLEVGGTFCFSVERAGDGVDFELRPSLRYAHSERYLRALAAAHGFDVATLHREPVREDGQQPIEGSYAVLRRR
jgi:predicted TPR repeat methyltransferase